MNRIAILIQAMGRIERVWEEVPHQSITMSEDVFNVFAEFMLSDDYANIRESRYSIISNNLQDTLNLVQQKAIAEQMEGTTFAVRTLAIAERKSRTSIDDMLNRLKQFRRDGKDTTIRFEWMQLRHATLSHSFLDPVAQKVNAIWAVKYCQDGQVFHSDDWLVYPADTKPYDAQVWRFDDVYRLISHNTFLSDHFVQHGYPLTFGEQPKQMFTNYIVQSILSGAIGEECIAAILASENIELDRVPDPLFETIDLKVMGNPWYIDCKNFTERTLDNFSLEVDTPGFRRKLNQKEFQLSAQRKLHGIQAIHPSEDIKLIYINLASDDDRPVQYFNDEFIRCNNFAEAKIIIIQGIIRRSNPDEFHDDFVSFVHDAIRG